MLTKYSEDYVAINKLTQTKSNWVLKKRFLKTSWLYCQHVFYHCHLLLNQMSHLYCWKHFPHYFVLLLALVYQNHLQANRKQFADAVDWSLVMPTILPQCFHFTVSQPHNDGRFSHPGFRCLYPPECHMWTNHSVYFPDEKLIHLWLPVWMNLLITGVW